MDILYIVKILLIAFILVFVPMYICAQGESGEEDIKVSIPFIGSFCLVDILVKVHVLTLIYAVYSALSSMWGLYN